MQDNLDEVNADTILSAGTNRLQSLGMILKKADCIIDLAILHDMRMVYHHRKIACKLFEKIPQMIKPIFQCGKPALWGGNIQRNT